MSRRIPPGGLTAEQLREAAATDFAAVTRLVMAAISNSAGRSYVDLTAIYPDRAVVTIDGRAWAYPYTIDADNTVVLAPRYEVVATFTAVREAAGTALVEALGDGGKYLIRVICAGLSRNGNFYPDSALREAVPMFDGVRVFAKSDSEHLKGEGKDIRNLIGRLAAPRFVAGPGPDTGSIEATLELINPSDDIGTKLREAAARDMATLFGFSIDATGRTKKDVREGKTVRALTQFTAIKSVDLIVEPGAGGALVRVVEAAGDMEADMALRDLMLVKITKHNPAAFAGRATDSITDDELESAYREAVAAEATPAKPAITDPPVDIREALQMIETRSTARETIREAKLPKPAQDRLLQQFADRERYTLGDVQQAIDAEKTYLGQFVESGKVALDFGQGARTTEDRADKVQAMLDDFFAGKVRSFRECYVDITGDRGVTGLWADVDKQRLREATGGDFREAISAATFSNVLGDSITRRMIADYQTKSEYDVWKPLTVPGNPRDFRTQERTRMGGYGDLPTVAENGAYQPLSSPGDEKATYAVGKKGGTEKVSLEAIANDDVGVIRQIPVALSRAAKRTLGKFVLDFFRTNPTIYDTVALFHASHNNLGAAALDATSLAAGRLAMLKQSEANSAERLSIGPRYLLVPAELQQTAADLFNRNTNNDKTFIQSLTLEILTIWYWTDANDWALACDPADMPCIELGFYGSEEPELFVQDLPTQGSLFSNDQILYKIRHIYGGAILNYRGLYKAVVA